MWFLRAHRKKTVLGFEYMDIGHQGYYDYKVAKNVTLWRFSFHRGFETQPVVRGILDHKEWRQVNYSGRSFADGRVEHDRNIGSCAIEPMKYGASVTEHRLAINKVFDWLESNFPGVTFYIYDENAHGIPMSEYKSDHL